MKLLTLHKKTSHINYKNSICSFAALFLFSTALFAVVAPFYLVSSLYKDLWLQYKVVYEQPDVQFKHKYIVTAELSRTVDDGSVPETKTAVCSSFKYLSTIFSEGSSCPRIKVSQN